VCEHCNLSTRQGDSLCFAFSYDFFFFFCPSHSLPLIVIYSVAFCTVSFCECFHCHCYLQWIPVTCACHHHVCCAVCQLYPSFTLIPALAFPRQIILPHAPNLLLHHQSLTLSLQTRVRPVPLWWQWVGGATVTVSRAR
jgi:hypothetical protein